MNPRSRRKEPSPERKAQLITELKSDKLEKDNSYRSQALKLYPHVCARCAREFEGKRLKELTVHHKDHNHDNNPGDGNNWELLCVYCHDNEHEKTLKSRGITAGSDGSKLAPSIFSQFEGLDALIPDDDKKNDS
jgi:5-methylcytosine-specific restriction endonuclease McrA